MAKGQRSAVLGVRGWARPPGGGHRRSWSYSALLLVSMLSCRQDLGPEPPVAKAIVYGDVKSTDGSPISGASVLLTSYYGACGDIAGVTEETVSDSKGVFRFLYVVGWEYTSGCTTVRASASGFQAREVGVPDVPYSDRYPPTDSVAVRVVLQPS